MRLDRGNASNTTFSMVSVQKVTCTYLPGEKWRFQDTRVSQRDISPYQYYKGHISKYFLLNYSLKFWDGIVLDVMAEKTFILRCKTVWHTTTPLSAKTSFIWTQKQNFKSTIFELCGCKTFPPQFYKRVRSLPYFLSFNNNESPLAPR